MENKKIKRRNVVQVVSLGILAFLGLSKAQAQTTPPSAETKKPSKDTLPDAAIPATVQPDPPVKKLKSLADKFKAQTNLIGNTNLEDQPAAKLPNVENVIMQRVAAEQNQWNAVQNQLNSVFTKYVFDENDPNELSDKLLNVEKGFIFKTSALDSRFSPLHIEPLLDQAADLLERCLRERSIWDETAVKMFRQTVELLEYQELDEILKEEQNAGKYKVDYETSNAEYNAEQSNHHHARTLEARVENALNQGFSDEKIKEVSGAVQLTGWLSGLPAYWFKKQKFHSYNRAKWGEETKEINDHLHDAATTTSYHRLFHQWRMLYIQKLAQSKNKYAHEERKKGLRKKRDWDFKNINFRSRRTKVARKYQDLKARAITHPNGVLNYGKRLDAIYDRFHNDFRDALARLKVVEQGLKQVYAYDKSLPESRDKDYFDKCLLWTRRAVEHLISFSRLEQTMVIPVSLLHTLPHGVFKAKRLEGYWEIDLTNFDLFRGMTHIRLRGLSAYVHAPDKKRTLWQLQIIPPKKAKVRYENYQIEDIIQNKVRRIYLGRVSYRNQNIEPDIAGIASLHNASPLGKWIVQLKGNTQNITNQRIENIHIDFHVAFRWSKEYS